MVIFAGTGTAAWLDGQATAAYFNGPWGMHSLQWVRLGTTS